MCSNNVFLAHASIIINLGYKGSLEPEWCLVSDEDNPFASKID